MRRVTDGAREESARICELCGMPAAESINFDYIKTLCSDCAARTGYHLRPESEPDE